MCGVKYIDRTKAWQETDEYVGFTRYGGYVGKKEWDTLVQAYSQKE